MPNEFKADIKSGRTLRGKKAKKQLESVRIDAEEIFNSIINRLENTFTGEFKIKNKTKVDPLFDETYKPPTGFNRIKEVSRKVTLAIAMLIGTIVFWLWIPTYLSFSQGNANTVYIFAFALIIAPILPFGFNRMSKTMLLIITPILFNATSFLKRVIFWKDVKIGCNPFAFPEKKNLESFTVRNIFLSVYWSIVFGLALGFLFFQIAPLGPTILSTGELLISTTFGGLTFAFFYGYLIVFPILIIKQLKIIAYDPPNRNLLGNIISGKMQGWSLGLLGVLIGTLLSSNILFEGFMFIQEIVIVYLILFLIIVELIFYQAIFFEIDKPNVLNAFITMTKILMALGKIEVRIEE